MKIYPNPTKDYLTIEAEQPELEDIHLFNSLGQNMNSILGKIENTTTPLMLNLANLPKGVYYLKTKTTTHKIERQ